MFLIAIFSAMRSWVHTIKNLTERSSMTTGSYLLVNTKYGKQKQGQVQVVPYRCFHFVPSEYDQCLLMFYIHNLFIWINTTWRLKRDTSQADCSDSIRYSMRNTWSCSVGPTIAKQFASTCVYIHSELPSFTLFLNVFFLLNMSHWFEWVLWLLGLYLDYVTNYNLFPM